MKFRLGLTSWNFSPGWETPYNRPLRFSSYHENNVYELQEKNWFIFDQRTDTFFFKFWLVYAGMCWCKDFPHGAAFLSWSYRNWLNNCPECLFKFSTMTPGRVFGRSSPLAGVLIKFSSIQITRAKIYNDAICFTFKFQPNQKAK